MPPSGTFANGTQAGNVTCSPSPCVPSPGLPLGWFVYDMAYLSERLAWYGTIIDAKRDAAGTHYRRNRVYDPQTGRFTQEDPIGLAGGVNLYGYAAGDPANFSDPFGLFAACDPPGHPKCTDLPLERVTADVRAAEAILVATSVASAGRSLFVRAAGGLRSAVQGASLMAEASSILRSGGMAELRAAAQAGRSAVAQIGGRTITYDPVPISGMTNFAEGTFHLGRNAFASNAELAKTVLHELFRLRNGAGVGASGASAAAETNAAFNFAERAYRFGNRLGIW